jgi:hypothetical protein
MSELRSFKNLHRGPGQVQRLVRRAFRRSQPPTGTDQLPNYARKAATLGATNAGGLRLHPPLEVVEGGVTGVRPDVDGEVGVAHPHVGRHYPHELHVPPPARLAGRTEHVWDVVPGPVHIGFRRNDATPVGREQLGGDGDCPFPGHQTAEQPPQHRKALCGRTCN